MALLDRLAPPSAAAAEQARAERATAAARAPASPIPAPPSHASNAIVVAGRLTAGGTSDPPRRPADRAQHPELLLGGRVRTRPSSDSHGVAVPGDAGDLHGTDRALRVHDHLGADDDTDVFAELLDPANPDHYLHDGQSLPFEHRTETFLVAGQAPVVRDYLRTVHGPVIFLDAGGRPRLRRAGARSTGARRPPALARS